MKKLLNFLLPIVYVTIILAGCQNQVEPQTLSAPQNVRVITNLTEDETTEWLLSWDAVGGADTYDVYVNGKYKTTTQENELNLNYVGTFNIGVVAVPELGNKNYTESDEASISYTFEKVTKGLTYTLLEDGTYSVTAENSGNATVTGRVVLADTYKGRIVSTLAQNSFKRKGGFSTVVSGPTYNELTTSIKLPSMLTTIEYYAFGACSKIEEIVLPETLTKIDEDAFANCSALKTISIPQSVTEIRGGIFQNCTSLKVIKVHEGIIDIGFDSFKNTAFYNDESNWNNEGALYLDNCLISVKTDVTGSFKVKERTRIVAGGAFFHCADITEVILPEGITTINRSTFCWDAALTNVYIPNSVTKIDQSAFGNCTSLTSITIPQSVTKIDQSAFNKCTSLTSITLPENLTEIGNSTFRNCSALTSITLHKNLTKIGNQLFLSCHLLETINFDGTMAEWLAIEKGEYWNYNTGDFTVICTDGKLDKDGNVRS